MHDKTRGSAARTLSEITDALLKPLHIASKDSFARINSVKGLELLVDRLSADLALIHPSREWSDRFDVLKKLFVGFDSLPVSIKIERITKAIEEMESPLPEQCLLAAEIDSRISVLGKSLQFCKGIGPKLAERFAKKGLATVEDILYFLPIRYEDRRSIRKIAELTAGESQVACGEVVAAGETRYGRRRVYEAAISDGSGILRAKWFNYKIAYMAGRLKPGKKVLLYGTVGRYGAQFDMIHPDVEPFDDVDSAQPVAESGGVTPVYSQLDNLHQKTMRKIVRGVVDEYAGCAVSGLPAGVMARHGLMEIAAAFRATHIPDAVPPAGSVAKKSLVFDELFVMELGLAVRRAQIKKEDGIAHTGGKRSGLEDRLRGLIPFKLTVAQERTLTEIKKDMAAPHPMNRLIQGDVGSGKTIVSLMAALCAVESGYQAAIMAPTEILAEQHYLTVHRYADLLGIKTLLLTGGMKKSERARALAEVAAGSVDLVIGTHALIQKDVDFARLGIAIIDEQHRFGVVQRAALKKKGVDAGATRIPDILIMTATPIPRTLCMSVFGDLDVSIIDELPPGRLPIQTRLLKEQDRRAAYELIRAELVNGNQCYVVYPLVEESRELSLKDAVTMKEHLQKDVFREFKVGLLHGRMKAAEKEAAMRGFKDKNIDVLVCTTVIEVGVDVPNATVMLIEHAERFGLAQLHQLRGRVGRGSGKSVCLLLAAWTNSEDTYRRLKVMERTQDGFSIAEEDLLIRGPGSFMGTQQAGAQDFRTPFALADLTILKKAREEALQYIAHNPAFSGPEGERIKRILKARWDGRLALAEIG